MTLFPRTTVRFTGRGVTIEAADPRSRWPTTRGPPWCEPRTSERSRSPPPPEGPHLALVRVTSFGTSEGPRRGTFSESERTPWRCFCWRNYRTSAPIHKPAGDAARAGPYRLGQGLVQPTHPFSRKQSRPPTIPSALGHGGFLQSVARTGAGRHHRPDQAHRRTLRGTQRAEHHHLSAHPPGHQDRCRLPRRRPMHTCRRLDWSLSRNHQPALRPPLPSVQARWAARDVEPRFCVQTTTMRKEVRSNGEEARIGR